MKIAVLRLPRCSNPVGDGAKRYREEIEQSIETREKLRQAAAHIEVLKLQADELKDELSRVRAERDDANSSAKRAEERSRDANRRREELSVEVGRLQSAGRDGTVVEHAKGRSPCGGGVVRTTSEVDRDAITDGGLARGQRRTARAPGTLDQLR